tara:strand:- start:401 stop:790 length:390 start_codon:yes stop_codon:yes gene_type:complete
MHIQALGETVNESSPYIRQYGMAAEYRIPQELNEWLSTQEATKQSPASGDVLYVPVELMQYGDVTQMLIKSSPEGTDPLNHPLGVVLNMKTASPAVSELLTFALANDLITVVIGEEPYAVAEEVLGEEE